MEEPSPKRRTPKRSKRKPGGFASEIFSQLALWTAANLAGMVTALMIARRPFFRKVAAQVGGKKTRAGKPNSEQSLAILSDAILGSSKTNIANVFGAPRGAVLEGEQARESDAGFLKADVWYYPLPRQGPLAMAIRFHEGFAKRVEFFSPPAKKLRAQ